MMKDKGMKLMLALVAVGCMLPGAAYARVSGQCSNCHTMHNSQDGDVFPGNTATPNEALTIGDCQGCHTGANSGAVGSVPMVQGTAAPTYGTNTLAGGSFWWVSQTGGDATGHNVAGFAGVDGDLATPPGDSGSFANQLTCAGTQGCHGDRTVTGDFAAISGSHHADDTTITGANSGTSYRFLNGILGIEDADWEFTATDGTVDHNQYYGVARTADTEDDTDTISALCADCHGEFHSGAGDLGTARDAGFSSPWIRHPTDIDMNAVGGEYAAYNDPTGTNGNEYSVVAPVASNNMANGVLDSVLDAPGDAVVTCISCHRAHGTPNDDLLRWDYSTVQAHTTATDDNNDGCFICHTTKDDQ